MSFLLFLDFMPSAVAYLAGLFYLMLIIYTMIRILLDTQSTPKTLAYILLLIAFPLIGIFIYYAFGINYRHRALKLRGLDRLKQLLNEFQAQVRDDTPTVLNAAHPAVEPYEGLVRFIHRIDDGNLGQNEYHLLVNGERKFPDVLERIGKASHSIHMEYYAWENDVRGNQVKEALLKKAAAGVAVRILYDAYASRKITNNIVKEMKAGGIEVYPVIRVKLAWMANRINHRDHRKLIIIDGKVGYIGGINVSDRYDNSIDTGLYWRDTHLRISGPTVMLLQRNFLVNWNIAQHEQVHFSRDLFPGFPEPDLTRDGFAQVVAGGPIYPLSNIMLTYARIFSMAREKLYITNPYFIPSDSITDALKQAAISGVDVRLMLPEKSDSAVVGAASRFYFAELLKAGVRIFLYRKGFVHAKTVVSDGCLSVVGTANMDIRSFDLNFEIMPVIYDRNLGKQLEQVFLDDLGESDEVQAEAWKKTGRGKRLVFAIARLISAFL